MGQESPSSGHPGGPRSSLQRGSGCRSVQKLGRLIPTNVVTEDSRSELRHSSSCVAGLARSWVGHVKNRVTREAHTGRCCTKQRRILFLGDLSGGLSVAPARAPLGDYVSSPLAGQDFHLLDNERIFMESSQSSNPDRSAVPGPIHAATPCRCGSHARGSGQSPAPGDAGACEMRTGSSGASACSAFASAIAEAYSP